MSFSGSYTSAALATEINTDPTSIGYSVYTAVKSFGGDTNIAGLANNVIAPFILTQATFSAGSVTYTGTITGGASNSLAGLHVQISGFTNAGNNASLTITSSTATTIVCINANGVNETHSATAQLVINMLTMTSAQVSAIMLPLFSAATGLTAVKYSYYTLMLSLIMSQTSPIPVGGMSVLGATMVTDAIMTIGQAMALGQRSGSRAEVLWGQGVVVTQQDVHDALGHTY